MGWLEIDDTVDEQLRDLAGRWGVEKGEALARVLAEWRVDESAAPSREDRVPEDATTGADGVPIHFDYLGVPNAANFDPATGHVSVTAGPARGRVFTSPSSAATKIVALINPTVAASRNGWITWKLVETGEVIDVIRRGER